MTDQEFEQLVHRLETQAEANPKGYQLRLGALASLAYVYVFGVVLLAVGLLAVTVAAVFVLDTPRYAIIKVSGKIGLALVAFLAAVARALWVRIPEPEGIEVTAEDHPALVSEIELLRVAAKAPRIHRILLTPELNASIVQIPRLGILGWPRNYLILGLPLLKALSLDGFRSVCAHELGHLSGSHGRWGAWIYASRRRWGAILDEMEREDHWASFLFRPFFRWYAPYFNAYSFVQARQQEYQADQVAAELVDPRSAGEALATIGIRGRQLDTAYWPEIEARMSKVATPDVEPFADMTFPAAETDVARLWLEEDLARPTTVFDTHPSLTDRLAALGVEPSVAWLPEASAADTLLTGGGRAAARLMDARWKERVADYWSHQYHQRAENAETLHRIEGIPQSERTEEDAWSFAHLTESERPDSDPLPLYLDVLRRNPDHAPASYAVGRLLLAAGETGGLRHLERAAALDDEAIIPAAVMAGTFLQERGRQDEAEPWFERARAHQTKLDAAQEERSQVRLDGQWDPHGLSDEELAPLRTFLVEAGGIERAWLLRRRLEHFPEFPLFVLAIRRAQHPTDWLSQSTKQKRDLEVQEDIQDAPMAGDGFILVTNHRDRRERKQFEGVAGSQILPVP